MTVICDLKFKFVATIYFSLIKMMQSSMQMFSPKKKDYLHHNFEKTFIKFIEKMLVGAINVLFNKF